MKPFMTVILTFEEHGGKTRYTARVRHWTVADRERHEQMGFHAGGAVHGPTRGARREVVNRALSRGVEPLDALASSRVAT